MSERVSKRAIELRVEWLNKALGRALVPWVAREDGKGSKATDAFYVDHQLGGYRLETGGNPIFGHARMSRNELCNQLEAILVAIRLARNEQSGSHWPAPVSASEAISQLVEPIARATLRRAGRALCTRPAGGLPEKAST